MDNVSLTPFINKIVHFKFDKRTLDFQLSQSLFSSAAVDDGSRLLLKAIRKQVNLAALQTVLDVGCGVGVLGLSLAGSQPQLALMVQDRDALALAFTCANARLNQIEKIQALEGLGLQNLHGRSFDLIISNLPGKAGTPVLQALVQRIPTYLADGGIGGLVVVKPLEDAILEALASVNCQILYRQGTTMHTVILFSGGDTRIPNPDPLAPYLRQSAQFTAEKQTYELDTVYNLPDFDTLGYATRLAVKMLSKAKLHGRLLFWNPGQGHLPVIVQQQNRDQISHITLGGRDALSLQISLRNLVNLGVSVENVTMLHLPTILEVTGQFDTVILFPDDDPGVPWSRLLPPAIGRLLTDKGRVLLVAKSGFIGRLLADNKLLRPIARKKYHGLKAAIMEQK